MHFSDKTMSIMLISDSKLWDEFVDSSPDDYFSINGIF